MKSVVAIVGRPNVGKSTLFNRLSRKRIAIVEDIPGVTRDRNYNDVVWDDRSFTLIDTGGFDPMGKEDLLVQMREQTLIAIEDADVIILLLDGKEGLTPVDKKTVDLIRRTEKPVFYAVNKIDGPEHEDRIVQFYELGIDRLYPISALHGTGVGELMDDLLPLLREEGQDIEIRGEGIRVAVIGRPNVGKSSLVNSLCGSPRSIVHPSPGTTRDPIDTHLHVRGHSYILIDTAGIRRKGRTRIALEKYCVIKALQSIGRCDVAILIVDAMEGPTDQDAHIAGYAYEMGKGLIIVVNKWDLVSKEERNTRAFVEKIRRKMRFLDFAPVHFVSALTGERVMKTLDLVDKVAREREKRIDTGILNRHFQGWVERFPPPLFRTRAVKLHYITQPSVNPPTFVIFTNYPEGIHLSYRRYIINRIREEFGFEGTPLRLVFKKEVPA